MTGLSRRGQPGRRPTAHGRVPAGGREVLPGTGVATMTGGDQPAPDASTLASRAPDPARSVDVPESLT